MKVGENFQVDFVSAVFDYLIVGSGYTLLLPQVSEHYPWFSSEQIIFVLQFLLLLHQSRFSQDPLLDPPASPGWVIWSLE